MAIRKFLGSSQVRIQVVCHYQHRNLHVVLQSYIMKVAYTSLRLLKSIPKSPLMSFV
uniref:Uncharacterized protein n=1 Tax=Anguilla anguilla TaxID=7936 RepID=A0A0E9WJS4_ANGAN